jgi:hypothetical protein
MNLNIVKLIFFYLNLRKRKRRCENALKTTLSARKVKTRGTVTCCILYSWVYSDYESNVCRTILVGPYHRLAVYYGSPSCP